MTSENLVSIKFTDEENTRIVNAINELKAVLEPKLKQFNSAKSKTVAKMGDGNLPFVKKTVEYTKSNPEFNPPFLDAAELEVDMKSVDTLSGFYRPLFQVLRLIARNIIIAGSESFTASLAYYATVKSAQKNNVPNAEVILSDLKKYFENRGRKKDDDDAEDIAKLGAL